MFTSEIDLKTLILKKNNHPFWDILKNFVFLHCHWGEIQ